MSLQTKLITLCRLASENASERKNVLYLLGMLCRGIDLRGVNSRELGLDQARSYWYSNSGGPDLDVVMRTLSISPTDGALDIGCGKGGAMITLAKYRFARVDGIEISSMLADVARRYLHRAKVTNATIFCCDAAEFMNFDPYTLLYLYNPFPAVVVETVLDNLMVSLGRRPRQMTLIYKNPTCNDLVIKSGFRKTSEFNHGSFPFYLYSL
jgi:SAM-dependent methyltransferase